MMVNLNYHFNQGQVMKPLELAAQVTNIEGHKSQARMCDVYEILAIVVDLAYKDIAVSECMNKWGIQRAKRKKRKKNANQSTT